MSEARRKEDLRRAKDEAAKLFGELSSKTPEQQQKKLVGTFEDMSAAPSKRRQGVASIYGKK